MYCNLSRYTFYADFKTVYHFMKMQDIFFKRTKKCAKRIFKLRKWSKHTENIINDYNKTQDFLKRNLKKYILSLETNNMWYLFNQNFIIHKIDHVLHEDPFTEFF